MGLETSLVPPRPRQLHPGPGQLGGSADAVWCPPLCCPLLLSSSKGFYFVNPRAGPVLGAAEGLAPWVRTLALEGFLKWLHLIGFLSIEENPQRRA